MKTACYSTCGPNVCSFFCSPSLSLSPIASAIFYSLLMFASFLFYIFQYFLHSHCVHGIGGPPIFICGLFFVHNLLNTCFNFLVVHLEKKNNILENISSLTSTIATQFFPHKINHIPTYTKNIREIEVELISGDHDQKHQKPKTSLSGLCGLRLKFCTYELPTECLLWRSTCTEACTSHMSYHFHMWSKTM